MSFDPQRPGGRRLLLSLATLLITALVFYLLAREHHPRRVLAALARGEVGLLGAAALLALGFNTLHSAELQRWLIRGFGAAVTYPRVLVATVGNLAIQGALPASTGHLVRVAFLNRRHGVPVAPATAAAAAGLWFKLLWLLAMATAGWGLSLSPAQVPGALLGLLLLAGMALTAAATPALRWLGAARGAGRLARRLDALEAEQSISTSPREALARGARSARPAALCVGALHALLSVLAELVIFSLVLRGLGVAAAPALVAARFSLVIVGSKVPLTVMGMGTREALVLMLFAGLAAPEVLLAAGLAYSVCEHLVPGLVGTLFTWSYLRRLLEATPRRGAAPRPGRRPRRPARG